jgi:hypothetical protein
VGSADCGERPSPTPSETWAGLHRSKTPHRPHRCPVLPLDRVLMGEGAKNGQCLEPRAIRAGWGLPEWKTRPRRLERVGM